MGIQYMTDESGRKVAVVIPMEEWETILRSLDNPSDDPSRGKTYGLTPEEARATRARLESFASDWDSPEMDSYDNYDQIKAGT